MDTDIEITGFDCIYGDTIRIWVTINGIKFKRITNKANSFSPVWDDVDAHFGNINMEKEKEQQLESIFQAFALQTKFDIAK